MSFTGYRLDPRDFPRSLSTFETIDDVQVRGGVISLGISRSITVFLLYFVIFSFLCTFIAFLVVVCEPHRHVLFLVVVCVPHRIGWPVCLIGRRIESVCIHAFHIAL